MPPYYWSIVPLRSISLDLETIASNNRQLFSNRAKQLLQGFFLQLLILLHRFHEFDESLAVIGFGLPIPQIVSVDRVVVVLCQTNSKPFFPLDSSKPQGSLVVRDSLVFSSVELDVGTY